MHVQTLNPRFLLCGMIAMALLAPSITAAADPPFATAQGAAAEKSVKMQIHRNLHYRDDTTRASACDVYVPANPSGEGRPAILIVHGGGWLSGDKWTTDTYARSLAQRGFVVMNMNYRLAPKYKFPAQVDDVRLGLLWLKSKAREFQIDVSKIGAFGYSAGGHLTALVALTSDEPIESRLATSSWKADDPRWKQMPRIAALCIGGPPCDFRPIPEENQMLAYFFGGSRKEIPNTYQAASPVVHVSPQDPPTRIIHGETDMLVPLKNSHAFNQALIKAGVQSELKIITGQGHMLTFMHSDTRKHTHDFFDDHFRDRLETETQSGSNALIDIKTSTTSQDEDKRGHRTANQNNG